MQSVLTTLIRAAFFLTLTASVVVSHAQHRVGISLRGGEMVAERRSQIACGGSVSDGVGFTAAIVDEGKLLMWGSGESGALGSADGSTEMKNVPSTVAGLALKKVEHVACGGILYIILALSQVSGKQCLNCLRKSFQAVALMATCLVVGQTWHVNRQACGCHHG